MRRLLIYITLIGLATSVFGQKKLSGKIIDADTDEVLIGATVSPLHNLSNGTATDASGAFQISISDTRAQVELLIQYIGYQEQFIMVDLANNQYVEILMQPSAVQIDEVMIKATPSLGEEFALKEITKLEIYTNPNSRADPIRAINSLPSSTSVDETANLSLRGSPAAETGFILNRVPIDDVFKLDQSNGVGQFSIFNTSIISKVDVYPSNPPLEFGGASSGLIALYTDDVESENSRSINLTLASIGFKMNQKLDAKNGLVGYANYSLNNGLKAINKKAFEDLESFHSFDTGLYWVSNINNTTKLKVFNYSLIEDYGYHVDLPSFDGTSLQEKKRNQTVINFEKKIGQKTNVDFNQGINFSHAKYDFGNTHHQQNKNDFFSSLNLSRFDNFFSFSVGLSAQINSIDNEGQYPEFYWALSPSHSAVQYASKETFFMPEFYSYQKLRFSDNLVLGIANRRTVAPSENVGEFSSNQINVSFDINPSNNVKIALGKYHKLFIPGEQFYETTLASSKQYSIDYSFSKSNFILNAAVYAKNTKFIERVLDIAGAELFVSYENEILKTSISLAHVSSKVQSDEGSYPSKNDLNYFFRHLLKYKIGTHVEINSVLFLRSGSHYAPIIGSNFHQSTQTFEPIYSSFQDLQRLPNYSLWDLSISKISQLGDGVMIFFISTSNVLGKKNISGVEYNKAYENIGHTYFGSRVFFMGAVYNW